MVRGVNNVCINNTANVGADVPAEGLSSTAALSSSNPSTVTASDYAKLV